MPDFPPIRDRDASDTLLLDTLLHQLRNPLTAMTTLAKLWQKRSPPDDPNAWIADRIEQECVHVRLLLEQFEQQAQGEAEATTPAEIAAVDLTDFLQQLWPTYAAIARERQIDLRQDFARISAIDADTAKLREVLDNLLDNALKYTPAGGEVCVRLTEAGEEIAIAISDSGPGIAPADLPLIFEWRFRGTSADLDPSGSGLGLAIARDLASEMGGSIDVSSLPGRGTTFTVRLPISERSRSDSPSIV
ncbi:MAG: HAMP domain-containing sensor histidine kinase [Cyanobacteria bacterium J06639_1]